MKWYIKCLRKYADFSGRARRKEYWMFVLFNFIFAGLAIFLDYKLFDDNIIDELGVIYRIYAIGVFLPNLAVTIRRLHDIGKSGWNIFITLFPVIGVIVFIAYMTTAGDPDNKYGRDPKGEENDFVNC